MVLSVLLPVLIDVPRLVYVPECCFMLRFEDVMCHAEMLCDVAFNFEGDYAMLRWYIVLCCILNAFMPC